MKYGDSSHVFFVGVKYGDSSQVFFVGGKKYRKYRKNTGGQFSNIPY